ncbi:MAG: 4Fe-4S binding protein [Promethearchaeota archaeon]
MPKERFVPVQIDQDQCLKCERCLHACKVKAIYFENSIRLVDFSKCVGCLTCQMICPRNAIQVTSVEPNEVVSIAIDHNKCSLCNECLDESGQFCPKNLYFKSKIKKNGIEIEIIKFKFKEIAQCQGCLKCEALCPESAIKSIVYGD